MPIVVLPSKHLDKQLKKQLKKGEIDSANVRYLADSLTDAGREDRKQRKKGEIAALLIGFFVPVIIVGLGVFHNIKTGVENDLTSVGMMTFVFVFGTMVGVVFLSRWLNSRYLHEFIAATRQHYPEISEECRTRFFEK